MKFKTIKIESRLFRLKTIWILSKLFCVRYSFCNVLKRRFNLFGTFLNLLVISMNSHWNSPLSCKYLWVHLNRDYGKCIYRKCTQENRYLPQRIHYFSISVIADTLVARDPNYYSYCVRTVVRDQWSPGYNNKILLYVNIFCNTSRFVCYIKRTNGRDVRIIEEKELQILLYASLTFFLLKFFKNYLI